MRGFGLFIFQIVLIGVLAGLLVVYMICPARAQPTPTPLPKVTREPYSPAYDHPPPPPPVRRWAISQRSSLLRICRGPDDQGPCYQGD